MAVRRLIGAASTVGVLSAASLLALTGPAWAAGEDDGGSEWVTLSASGSGDDEVPAGTGEEGTDLTASISLAPDGRMTYTIKVTGNEEDIESAHIHKGAEGENGDVVVELDAKAIDAGRAAKVELEPDLAERIIDNPGNWYINTHSASFEPPTGVARAQLVKADEVEEPDIIDTGDGGQFAASRETPDAGALLAGGLLIAAAAGGAAVVRRRSGSRS
jgi:CHRD domain-containing protein